MPGDLDPTFGLGGRAITSFPDFGQARSLALAIDPDSRIVVAGYRSHLQDLSLVRYDSTGQLDPAFGDNGRVTLTSVSYPTYNLGKLLSVQPDGKILAGVKSPAGLAVVRLLEDGSLDPGFGSGGIATTTLGALSATKDIELQPDGKIVALGMTDDDNAVLVRFDSIGTLDPTFSGDGILPLPLAVGSGFNGIAVQGDGRIVIVGFQPAGGFWDFLLTRVTANGTVDAAFGTAGVVTTDFASHDDEARAVAIQPDGGIVVTGRVYTSLANSFDIGVARYDPDGNLDTSFSGDGLVTTAIADQNESTSLVLQTDGSIVVTGWASDDFNEQSHYWITVARYDSAGTLDATFGNGGVVLTELDGSLGFDIAVQADGRIVVTAPANDMGFVAVRYQVGSCTPNCGDALVDGCESCDDGDLTDGDGCDSNCTRTACGNGIVAGAETCDDANAASGDGCDLLCRPTGCGSGSVTPGEACDDGNAIEGDGCDSNCTLSACGNGIPGGEEACDDGNAVPGDGCEADCTLTPVAVSAAADDTVTTDVGGVGASESIPLQLSLTTPNAGEVSIAQAPPGSTGTSYAILGFELQIEAPPASASDPLVLVFVIDASAIPDDAPIPEIVVLRDGQPVADCSGAPLAASPDPCVSSRLDIGGGDAEVTVRTSHASLWTNALGALGKPAVTCLAKLNSSALKVAKAQLKLNQSCVKATAQGTSPDTNSCVLADASGKVGGARDKTVAAEDDCASPPRFGYDAVTLNDAAEEEAINLIETIFGSDVSAAILFEADADASCQATALSKANKLFLKVGKTYFKCMNAGVAGKNRLIVSTDGLQVCMSELEQDVSGTLGSEVARLQSSISKSCAPGALESVLPGMWSFNCGQSQPSLCLAAGVKCRACRMLNRITGLSHLCDVFDDAAGNNSCI